MHEIGICQAILEAVQRQAAGRAVTRFGVRAGLLNHLEPDAMRQGFEVVSQGSRVEGAELNLEVIPGRADCNDCGGSHAVKELFTVCPGCGSPDLDIEAGDELIVTWIEYPREVDARAEAP